jgi:starvation-inducible DNA-binding protein
MLQKVEARVIPTLPGVDWELADDLAVRLNRDLATLTDLAAAYKQAHWNVVGPGFAALHNLFDRFAEETRGYVDLVAERAVTLGGVAHGTVQAAAEHSILTPFPLDERDERRILHELSRSAERMAQELRVAIESSTQEPVTQDVYIEIARGIEMQRWMLLGHLAQPSQASSIAA